MIIENLIKIAQTDKDIKRIKEHKYTQKEQNKINKIINESTEKININNFIKEIEKIIKED